MRLKDLRKGAGLTQDAVAKAIGMTVGHYNRVENGRQALQRRYVAPLARALSIEETAVLDSGISIAGRSPGAIAENIVALRVERAMTQSDLAARLDISQVTLSRLEQGEQEFTVARLQEVAAIFEIGLVEVLAGSGDPVELLIQAYLNVPIDDRDEAANLAIGVLMSFVQSDKGAD